MDKGWLRLSWIYMAITGGFWIIMVVSARREPPAGKLSHMRVVLHVVDSTGNEALDNP